MKLSCRKKQRTVSIKELDMFANAIESCKGLKQSELAFGISLVLLAQQFTSNRTFK